MRVDYEYGSKYVNQQLAIGSGQSALKVDP